MSWLNWSLNERERDQIRALLADPEQSALRTRRIHQLVGEWRLREPLSEAQFDEVRALTGQDAWMLADDVLVADGWTRSVVVWWTFCAAQDDAAEPAGSDTVDDSGEGSTSPRADGKGVADPASGNRERLDGGLRVRAHRGEEAVATEAIPFAPLPRCNRNRPTRGLLGYGLENVRTEDRRP